MELPWRQKKKTNKRNVAKKTSRGWNIKLPNVRGNTLGMSALVLVLAAVICGSWWVLMKPQTLPMKQVQLKASFLHVKKEELHAVIAPRAEGGFFNVDVEGLTLAIEALPWVEKASVRRVWPDTLDVTVQEQQALALWNTPKREQALVNIHGDLFYPNGDSFPESLVKLVGPENTASMVAEQFRFCRDVLEGVGLAMAKLTLTSRRAWELELENGTTILLGRNDVAERMRRFVEYYPQLVAKSERVAQMDMRYTNGFAVMWRVPVDVNGTSIG